MRKLILILPILLCFLTLNAQEVRKHAIAIRITYPPKIDGIPNDSVWTLAPAIEDFTQYTPTYKVPPTQPTSVKILYDDFAIYVGAYCYDSAPDSIFRQLGNRDEGLNADAFAVRFDTYNNQMDAYMFGVYASGVQLDSRVKDGTYDAVWESQVKILPNGWSLEMKIPYSAIRFPSKEEQVWGLQITRSIRRNREHIQWGLEVKGSANIQQYWGELLGITHINPPLRLSLTPYFSAGYEHNEALESENKVSTSYSGGTDLKLGLNESFTLDMTLLPDFSQVQSDNKVKNLSAFETVYSEQRPFFREAVDLFKNGGLFYSRRISRLPMKFYSIADLIDSNEVVTRNPSQTKLLNATKISGRTTNGWSLGILNAVTGNTYAEVKNPKTGTSRKILTHPLSNYNILVASKELKNKSSAYLINTSVLRNGSYHDANVTGAGIALFDKKNIYELACSAAASHTLTGLNPLTDETSLKYGYRYDIGLAKVSGNLNWNLSHNVENPYWDANDFGITFTNDEKEYYSSIGYSIFEPFWKLRNFNSSFSAGYANNFTTKKQTSGWMNVSVGGTWLNYLSIWVNAGWNAPGSFDYYEPRVTGRFYKGKGGQNVNFGFSSDYRKKVSIDGGSSTWKANDGSNGMYFWLHPIFRLNNHILIDHNFSLSLDKDEKGFVAVITNDSIVFGKRDITTWSNTLSGRYMFRNNLSLSVRIRHYWSTGIYNGFSLLTQEGNLQEFLSYSENHNFNFNTFAVDLNFHWEFSPGSWLNITWKNNIDNEKQEVIGNYFKNLRQTWDSPQINALSIKLIYYLDYHYLKKITKKNF